MSFCDDIQRQHHCLETLANELRLAIIHQLDEHGTMNVTQLAAATRAERSRVSHALASLKTCKLIIAEKKGREVRYHLNPDTPLFQKTRGSIFDKIRAHAQNNCPTGCSRLGTA